MAIPGSVVAAGKLVTPGGAAGPKGDPAPSVLADTTQNGLLRQVSGNVSDFVDGTNHCQPIAPQIWSVRLRSFNAIGNPNFEVDQRNAGASITAATSAWACDRWQLSKSGGTTMAATGSQVAGTVNLPGTSFAISGKCYRVTLTATQATLGASDIIWFNQNIEGPLLRELISDVHSVQVLVRSSVAGLMFGVALRDAPAAVSPSNSLTKLCTIPNANTWTLITLPSLPTFPVAAWAITPGAAGYQLSIALICGSTFTASANNTWQTGNFVGAPGQSNFAAGPVNSTFDIAFVQHEPGSLCTTPIDLPFSQNYHECQRYYSKSTSYGNRFPDGNWQLAGNGFGGNSYVRSGVRFPRVMAKTPTMRWTGNTVTLNQVYYDLTGVLYTVTSSNAFDAGINNISLSAALSGTVLGSVLAGWDADTAW
jgi:hypothetical protein